jgi:heterodisulfide reductase subunit C2
MSSSLVVRPGLKGALRSFVEAHINQNISRCYQCGKCTSGCPAAYAMDITPRRVLRALQLGLETELEQSATMWICLTCQTCTARCPREIDVAGVMEALRLAARRRQPLPSQRRFRLFHELFIASFQFSGKAYELGLGMAYNLLSGQLLNMASVLPGLLRRGKIAFIPHVDGSRTQRIFRRVEALQKANATQEDRS